jgi:hypothetical protein
VSEMSWIADSSRSTGPRDARADSAGIDSPRVWTGQ